MFDDIDWAYQTFQYMNKLEREGRLPGPYPDTWRKELAIQGWAEIARIKAAEKEARLKA